MFLKNKLILFQESRRFAVLLIVLAALLVYGRSLSNEFIWDDHSIISKNDFIKSWGNFSRVFNESYLTKISNFENLDVFDIGSGETSYRPVLTITYFLDYHFWRLNPFGFHLTSLLLHVANCILLYFFVCLLSQNKKLSLFTALLFCVHPVNSEAVGVVSFREDVLVSLFCLGAFILYIRAKRFLGAKKLALNVFSVACFFLALFSKETALVFPLLILGYIYFFSKEEFKANFCLKFPWSGYIVAVLFYIIVRFFLFVNTSYLQGTYPTPIFLTNVLTMLRVCAVYIAWAFIPLNLHPRLSNDTELICSSFLETGCIFSAVLLILLVILAARLSKKMPVLSFSVLWFFVTFIPISNIFYTLTNYVACRYLYLPLAGLCVFFTLILFKFPYDKVLNVSRTFAVNLIIIILLFFSFLTFLRNFTWQNDFSLWEEMAEQYPDNSMAHIGLAGVYKNYGIFGQAIAEYKRALRLPIAVSDAAEVVSELGVCYFQKGLIEKAIKNFRKAVELDPALYSAYVNIGCAFGQKGDYPEAINWFKQVLALSPIHVKAYNNLGITYAKMGEMEQAKHVWEKALEIEPSYKEAENNLNKLDNITN
ncbi:MAG: tetratricopeptide repeat protein [Candidatus Omnitrophota bacterium]